MSAHGVKSVLNAACLQMVSMFMPCWVTIRCLATLGGAVCIAFTSRLGCVRVGYLGLAGTIAGTCSVRCGAGINPGVLFRVTCQLILGVIFNMRLAVGLGDFMIGLA